MKNTDYTSTFKSIMTDSAKFNEHNDCAVKAVAIATGEDYSVAHAMLRSLGRQNRHGTKRTATLRAMEKLGFKLVKLELRSFTDQYHGKWSESKTVTTKHPRRFPKVWGTGTYLLFTKSHVLPCVEGTVHDWTQERSLRVREVYRVERVGAPAVAPSAAPQGLQQVAVPKPSTAALLKQLEDSYVTVISEAAGNPAIKFQIKGRLELQGLDGVKVAVGTDGFFKFHLGQVTSIKEGSAPSYGALITVR